MKVNIQSIHFDADIKLLDFITKKVEKAKTFYDGIDNAMVYLRLEKDTVSENISSISKKINDGQWRLLKKGTVNKAIVSTGSCIQRSFEIIKNKNFKNYHVFSVPIWSMKSKKIQKKYLKKFKELLVVENHFEDGGFSSWLREAEGDNLNIKIKSISLLPQVTGKVGNKNFLEKKFFKKLSKIY